MANDKMNIQFRIKAVDNFSKNMNKLSQQLDKVQRKAEQLGTIENIKIGVTGDKKAIKDLEDVEDKAESVGRKSVWIAVKTTAIDAWNDYRRTMGKIATFSRNVGELIQTQLMSSFLVMSPTAVSGIASIGGALGGLLPVIGTVSGGVLGLASSFASAGTGAVAFGALAASALGDVFEVNEDIQKLREELAQTDDLEERAEINEEIAAAMATLTSEQQKAYQSMRKVADTWSDLSSELQPQIVTVFSNAMESLDSVLQRLEPMFTRVADTAADLSEAMRLNMDSDDFNAFIRFLNTDAAPMMETMTKAVGNFGMGFTNLLVAFGPLAQDMAKGLEDMASRFRDWTAGLSESERFNAFIDYVRENGPKLLGIVDNIVDGLVGMGEAFAPFASDMLDGFLEMTQGFEDWAKSLKDDPAFQEFIDYVKQEGPNFLAIMGELRDLLINLGKGFASVAEVLNPLIEDFLDWVNSVMEANPWIAKFAGWLTVIAGALGMVLPPFLLFKSIFGPLIMSILTAVTNMTTFWGALKMLGGYVLRAVGFLVRFIGVWGLVAGILIWVADIFKENFDKIYNWTMDTFQSVQDFISEKLDAIQEKFDVVLSVIDRLTGGKFSNILNAIREAMSASSDIIKRTIQFFKDTFDKGLRFLKALVDGDFGEMWRLIKEQMQNIEDTISDIWGNVMDFFGSIDLYDIGRDILRGMANGVLSMSDELVESVSGVVGGAIDKAKNLLGIASPSKVFAQIGKWTGEGFIGGMDKMVKGVSKTAEVMVGASVPDVSAHKNASFQAYPSRDNYESEPQPREGDTINIAPEATFIVREEADIQRIKQELGNETKKIKRIRGEV